MYKKKKTINALKQTYIYACICISKKDISVGKQPQEEEIYGGNKEYSHKLVLIYYATHSKQITNKHIYTQGGDANFDQCDGL